MVTVTSFFLMCWIIHILISNVCQIIFECELSNVKYFIQEVSDTPKETKPKKTEVKKVMKIVLFGAFILLFSYSKATPN